MNEVTQVEQEQVLTDRLSNEEKFRIASWSCGTPGFPDANGVYTIEFRTTDPYEKAKLKRLLHLMGKTWHYIHDDIYGDVIVTTHNGEILRPFHEWVDPETRNVSWCRDFIEECSVWMLYRECDTYSSGDLWDIPILQKAATKAGFSTDTSADDIRSRLWILYPSDAPKQ